jgi:hypothetical protein
MKLVVGKRVFRPAHAPLPRSPDAISIKAMERTTIWYYACRRRRNPRAGLTAFDRNSDHYRAHAVLPFLRDMLNVSHAAIGRIVAVFDAGFGLVFSV